MTQMKVQTPDELEAGREINGFVLHEIFGWSVEINPDGHKRFIAPDHQLETLDRVKVYTSGLELWTDEQGAPPYSTDISAAWKVVEKLAMDSKGDWELRGPACCVWYAQFNGYGPRRRRFSDSAVSLTLPLAICRCALKAICGE